MYSARIAANFSTSTQSSRFSISRTTTSSDTYSEIIPQALSFDELNNVVEVLQQNIQQLELENEIFQAFLEHNNPDLLTGMEDTLEMMADMVNKIAEDLTSKVELSPQITSNGETADSPASSDMQTIVIKHQIPPVLAKMVGVPSSISIRQAKSISGSQSSRELSSLVRRRMILAFERCPRMNYAQRLDVATWAMDRQQQRLTAAVNRGITVGRLLRAQIEAMGLRINETRNMMFHLNSDYDESSSRATKTPTAEKFIRDVRETVLNLEAIVERLRLKMGTMQINRKRLLAELAVKRELSESLRPVDIQTLKIQNEELLRAIALKTNHLTELKNVSGQATQKVNSHKKRLLELTMTLKNIRNEVAKKRNHIEEIEKEEKTVIVEAHKAERALNQVRERMTKFTQAPDVLKYVQQKHRLRELRKELLTRKRMWTFQSQTAKNLRRRTKVLGLDFDPMEIGKEEKKEANFKGSISKASISRKHTSLASKNDLITDMCMSATASIAAMDSSKQRPAVCGLSSSLERRIRRTVSSSQ